MSTGRRIMQKRKELGLSQEALGEQMGVSRQAIYKWETDAALPEIEKLVALSKYFHVSVGWLLGVEEDYTPEREESATLNETQLEMVEQIVKGYIQSQPAPKSRRKWPWILAACVLFFAFIHLTSRMDQLNSQYNSLQIAVNNISGSVNSQIGSIASRVEQILKDQNQLTAEYNTQLANVDYRNNSATITMKAVPRAFVEGMKAVFVVDNGDGPAEFEGTLIQSQTFTCEAVVPLSDCITVSVVFVNPDGTRQTQVMDIYEGLLARSYAELTIMEDDFRFLKVVDGKINLKNFYLSTDEGSMGLATVTACRVGLFRNKKLLAWAEPCEKPVNYQGFYGAQFYRLPDMTIENLTDGESIEIAALVTDSFDRQYMICHSPCYVITDGELNWPAVYEYEMDPSKWVFE